MSDGPEFNTPWVLGALMVAILAAAIWTGWIVSGVPDPVEPPQIVAPDIIAPQEGPAIANEPQAQAPAPKPKKNGVPLPTVLKGR